MSSSNNIYKKWMKNNKSLKKINKIQLSGMKINWKNQKIWCLNIKLSIKIYNSKSIFLFKKKYVTKNNNNKKKEKVQRVRKEIYNVN